MSLVAGLLIIAAAAAFVIAPFFRTEPEPEAAAALPDAQPAAGRDRLERHKLEAYAAIKEAEFDFRMGKLSETDFAALKDKYSAQALEAIAVLDVARGAQQRQEPRRSVRIAYCPVCGHGLPPRASFCPACGRSLKEALA